MEQARINSQECQRSPGPSHADSPGARYDFLDWLRVIAIFVLLFFHTGMIFVGWGWHIMNEQRIESLVIPMDISHRLRMPLLFVIAGASMWFALQRRTGAQLFKERTVRLLLPLAFGMLVVVPPQTFFQVVTQYGYTGGFAHFYALYLGHGLCRAGHCLLTPTWNHLWYLAYLLPYTLLLLATVPLLRWLRERLGNAEPTPLSAALLLALATQAAIAGFGDGDAWRSSRRIESVLLHLQYYVYMALMLRVLLAYRRAYRDHCSNPDGATFGWLATLLSVSLFANGFVLTFDDITDQLSDQRRAAWSDIARRIAHEIKNPLTPIQLAAERLQRRYGEEVASDPETFARLTDTIVRQVGDLRRMVDEFSNFARMPKPVFREENVHDIARAALFLHEVAHPGISFSIEPAVADIRLVCDRRQLGQALTNIVKNAVEAIESRRNRGEQHPDGDRIDLSIHDEADQLVIELTDTGVGLPQDRERLTEPYMTTRVRGTGLGLAIVKKIVEEHMGEIAFLDRARGRDPRPHRLRRRPPRGHGDGGTATAVGDARRR